MNMDQEEIEALELTKEDLLAKMKAGRRDNLPRKVAGASQYVAGSAVIVGTVAHLRLESAFLSLPSAIAPKDVNLS